MARCAPMHGEGVVVLHLPNHRFYEHETIAAARTEAERLALKLGGPCVVYVPVLIAHPPRPACTERVSLPHDAQAACGLACDDDLPF